MAPRCNQSKAMVPSTGDMGSVSKTEMLVEGKPGQMPDRQQERTVGTCVYFLIGPLPGFCGKHRGPIEKAERRKYRGGDVGHV